jgi:hypothetical protein
VNPKDFNFRYDASLLIVRICVGAMRIVPYITSTWRSLETTMLTPVRAATAGHQDAKKRGSISRVVVRGVMVLEYGKSAPLDGHAADSGDDAASHGYAVNLIAVAGADGAEVNLRLAHPRSLVTQLLALSTPASVLCGD